MSRSAKQIKNDISRIKLEVKNINQQMEITAKQYEKLGYVIPKKIRENRATERDIQGYWSTITNAVNNRLAIQEAQENRELNQLLKEHSKIQSERETTVRNLLDGYGTNFTNDFIKGKQAILGRNSTFSITSAESLNVKQVLQKASRTKQTPQNYLNKEITSLKADLQNLKSVNKNERNYIANQIKELIETQGLSLSNSNMNKIKSKLISTDWLGSQKILDTINARIDNAFYSIYKQSLEQNNNSELLDSIFSDISKSSHVKMTMYSRIMGN